METLSIIAYKQPITKVEVEQVRGVNCDYSIQKLLEKELIAIQGRSNAPGRPLIYKTSDNFYGLFWIEGPLVICRNCRIWKARKPMKSEYEMGSNVNVLFISTMSKKYKEKPVDSIKSKEKTTIPKQGAKGKEKSISARKNLQNWILRIQLLWNSKKRVFASINTCLIQV